MFMTYFSLYAVNVQCEVFAILTSSGGGAVLIRPFGALKDAHGDPNLTLTLTLNRPFGALKDAHGDPRTFARCASKRSTARTRSSSRGSRTRCICVALSGPGRRGARYRRASAKG